MEKDFYHYLYSSSTISDVLERYCTPMQNSNNPLKRMKASGLLKCWGLLTSKDSVSLEKSIKNAFSESCKEIEKRFPYVTYELIGRIKALVSTLNKADSIEDMVMSKIKGDFLNKYFPNGLNDKELKKFMEKSFENKSESYSNEIDILFWNFLEQYKFESNPFDRIRDFFAFRVVLEDDGPGHLIDELYEISNILIAYFEKNNFKIQKSHPLRQTGELAVDSNLIYVPEKSGIKPEYQPYVKDYVVSPKTDGYQSIHFVVFDPTTERYFEIQLRTRSMDIISETLTSHDRYKEKKYRNRQKKLEDTLDFSKIHIKGFRYFKYNDPITGKEAVYISDKAGIINHIPFTLELENFFAQNQNK